MYLYVEAKIIVSSDVVCNIYIYIYTQEIFKTLLNGGGHKDVNRNKFSKLTHTGKMSVLIIL